MPNFLPPPLRGAITFLLLLFNTLLWCTPFVLLALFKLIPWRWWRRRCTRALLLLGEGWIAGVNLLTGMLPGLAWDIEAPGPLHRNASYLLLANHQSWADIPVLLRLFGGRIPFPVFFVKKQLRRLPLIGLAMWALDFPFVERYSREEVERRPELRGRDLETARQACKQYRGTPVTLVNFPEGTRFAWDKHRQQGSPFRHLLTPHPGGTAVVLSTLGPQLATVLDATIAYPEGPPRFWDFLCGRVPQVRVRVRQRPIPPQFAGRDFWTDAEFRQQFRTWLEGLWREKDRQLTALLRQPGASG